MPINKIPRDAKISLIKLTKPKEVPEILLLKFTIKPDTEESAEKWVEINTKYSEIWPNINKKIDAPQDWKKFENEENKFEKYFKENL